jgi:subtilisin family serine protease
MAKVNVIVELNHSKKLENNAFSAMEAGVDVGLDIAASQKLSVVDYDTSFSAVMVPALVVSDHPQNELFDTHAALAVDETPVNATYLVRGTVEESDIAELEKEAEKNAAVVNIYADVGIEPMIICPSSPPLGSDTDVERLLCTAAMRSNGMDGSGVLVAIVDTGVNMAYLNSRGKNPTFDAARSWAWNPASVTPGSAPVDHGTMCAFDVCISAPKCTILDIALLHPISAVPGGSLMSGLLSDAIRAYSHLLTVANAPRRPGESRSLVVNNSWGMFQPSWDFPVGHPGNYSDNPNHPFNRIVITLERAGADILFAAGNCGADCPDGRCGGITTKAIYGANSSEFVTCVAGVDTTKQRVGYSAIGPGRLTLKKPDISGYTHFKGSGVYAADGGTSAACPVVAGVVAAVRSRKPFNPSDSTTSPAAIRNLITSTAQDLGATGYDFQHGFGVVDGCALASRFTPDTPRPPFIDICRLHPGLCDVRVPPIIDFCRRFPHICGGIRIPRIPRIPPIPPIPGLSSEESSWTSDETSFGFAGESEMSSEEVAYLLGYLRNQSESSNSFAREKKGCNCGCKD